MSRAGGASLAGLFAAALLGALLGIPRPALAAEMDDPLALRDQLPLHLLFHDLTPRGARLLPPRGVRLEVRAVYENTFAASDALIGRYRRDDFATLDGIVTPQALRTAAGAAPGGAAYFLDGEVLRLTLDFGVALGRRFELDATAPILLHTAGAFDTVIDSYHRRLDLPDGGRTAFAQDRYIMGLESKEASVFVDRAPRGPRPGDVALTGRFALLQGAGRRPAVTAGMSVKLPTGAADRLDGSGRADWGASIESSWRLRRSSWHGACGVVRPGGWSLAPRLRLQNLRTLAAGYALSFSEHSALIAQLFRTSGPFRYSAGSDLGRTALEMAVGMRHHLPGGRSMEWAIVENLDHYQNTPDIGGYLGWTLAPVGSPPPS